MDDCINTVYETILSRRDHPVEKSYTRYLFDQGIDKILKKIGEESAEVLIAAKNGDAQQTIGEIGDLTYHVLVLMALQGITPQQVARLLNERHGQVGNLKTFKTVDKNS